MIVQLQLHVLAHSSRQYLQVGLLAYANTLHCFHKRQT